MKKSFWLSFPVTIAAIVLSLILRSILAKDFAKDELGFYYAAVDAIFFAVLPFLGFRAAMTIYFAKGELFKINVLRQRYAMIVAFLPIFALSMTLAQALGANISAIIMLGALISVMLNVYFNNQLGMIRAYAAINTISFIEPLVPLLLYLAFKPSSTDNLIILFAIAFFVPAIFAAIYIWRKGYIEPKFEAISFKGSKRFYKDSLFASLEFGFGMATLFGATFIAAHNANSLSDFQVVIKPILMFALTLFVFPILRFLAPEIAKAIGENNMLAYLNLKKFTIRYACGAFLLLAFCLIWRNEIIKSIFSDQYLGGADALIFIAIACFFAILNTFSLAAIKALDGFVSSFFTRAFGFCFFMSGYFWISTLIELTLWLSLSHFAMWSASSFILKLRFNMSKLAPK